MSSACNVRRALLLTVVNVEANALDFIGVVDASEGVVESGVAVVGNDFRSATLQPWPRRSRSFVLFLAKFGGSVLFQFCVAQHPAVPLFQHHHGVTATTKTL